VAYDEAKDTETSTRISGVAAQMATFDYYTTLVYILLKCFYDTQTT